MLTSLPPGMVMVLGALFLPLLPRVARAPWMWVLPVLSFLHMWGLPDGTHGTIALFDLELAGYRVDKLSLVWGTIFHIAALLSVIFSHHLKQSRDQIQHVAALAYAGSAIAAVFAADLLTLFVYWELTAITSVWLIWAAGKERSFKTGMRYLIIQVASGVILLAGVLVRYHQTGSVAFDHIGMDSPGGTLILLSFGIKAAFPLLHNWLQDSYPEATPTGSVWLSAFTTKLAIYALARGYAGTELLIPIGAMMTVYPIFFAEVENDLRKVLSYSLNNQLGYMVVGIGVGTEMALNGTASHAFAHILYKGLLFMSMAAVIHRVGHARGSDLGQLYKEMPFTAVCCIIGAASISAFPLTSGFVSKSMILTAAADQHHTVTWLVLVFASAGVLFHSGIKIPFFAFFGSHQARTQAGYARKHHTPWNMKLAMGLAAALCLGIGMGYPLLYAMLPYAADYVPYTTSHVIGQLQLLVFALFAFAWMKRSGIYPREHRAILLDFDWTYRKALPAVWRWTVATVAPVRAQALGAGGMMVRAAIGRAERAAGRESRLAATRPAGVTALVACVTLGLFLVLYFAG